jgi:glycosyltransferase involved in cell wall biosynthesis
LYGKKNTPLLTKEQLADTRLVSVIMPAKDCERPHIDKTIAAIRRTAVGPIEIIVILDGWQGEFDADKVIVMPENSGQRVCADAGANMSSGEFIYRLDPHGWMSDGWDARLKSSCRENTMVLPVIDTLDEETWGPTGKESGFWILDGSLHCVLVHPWIPLNQRDLEEPAMSPSGGAWMIRKDYYDELGGHDERIGRHGNVGAEWALKVWLTGGEIIVRTDTVYSHLFRAKSPFGWSAEDRDLGRAKLYKQWVLGEDPRRKRPIEWLLYKFRGVINKKPTVNLKMK